jgi:hypothetical protein
MVNMDNLQVSDNEKVESPQKGRGQYERKARGSYRNEKKITIRYYPNKRLKPIFEFEGVPHYPIYFQVTVNGHTTQLPSLIFNDIDIPPQNEDLFTIQDLQDMEEVKKEKEVILCIINSLNPINNNDFKMSEFSALYKSLNKPVSSVVKGIIVKEIERLLKEEGDVEPKTMMNIFNNVNDSSPLRRHFDRLNMIPDEKNTLLKFGEDIWNIEHFEEINMMRIKYRKFYNPTTFYSVFESLSSGNYKPDDSRFLFSAYLKGEYQKVLIDEFDMDIAHDLLEQINLLFETYLSPNIHRVVSNLMLINF